MDKTPFPLSAVLPILVSASSFLKTREDREDAIQDLLEVPMPIASTQELES